MRESIPESLFEEDDVEPDICMVPKCKNVAMYRHTKSGAMICSEHYGLFVLGEWFICETEHHQISFGADADFEKMR